MTKAEIVSLIKESLCKDSRFSKSKITLQLITEIIDEFFIILKEKIAENEHIELRGFGTFELKIRKAKKALNPRTKERVFVGEHAVPIFRPGREFKNQVRNSLNQKNRG